MPGISIETFIGVRVPQCRELAKELYKTKDDETVKERNKTIQKACWFCKTTHSFIEHRKKLFSFVRNFYFELFIMSVLILS